MAAAIRAPEEHVVRPLRIIVSSASCPKTWGGLVEFGIHLQAEVRLGEPVRWSAVETADVALVDAHESDATTVIGAVREFKAAGVAVVVLVDVATIRDGMPHLGADVVSLRENPFCATALLIRSAFQSMFMRRQLEQQVSALEQKLEENKQIGRAKAIVAERMKISEAEALRHLRREARNRRRPLSEVAQTLIDAQEMLSSSSARPAQSPLAGRLSGVKAAIVSKAAGCNVPGAITNLTRDALSYDGRSLRT